MNYGLLLWGVHLQDISVLQKKAISVVTNNTYKSHTEPICKEYGLLNVNDMFLLNKLKFLHNLPVYFEGYWEHFTNPKQKYNLRSCILPVPRIHHVCAESLFVCQLIKLLNGFDNSVIIKLKERRPSFPGFSNYVTLKFTNNYPDQQICNIPDCYACKRN